MRTTRRSIFEDDWVWLPQGARGREIYIRRGSLKRRVPRSKWANTFVIGVHGNRPGVINLFRDFARKTFSGERPGGHQRKVLGMSLPLPQNLPWRRTRRYGR